VAAPPSQANKGAAFRRASQPWDVSTRPSPKSPAWKSFCSCSVPAQESGLPLPRAAEIWACPHGWEVQPAMLCLCKSPVLAAARPRHGHKGGPTSSGLSTLTCRADPPPIPVSALPLSAALLSPIRSCRSARLTRKLQPQPDPQQRAATQPRANPRQSPPAPCLGVLAVRGHLRAQGLFQVGQSIALCDNSTHPPGPPNSASPRLPTHPAPSHKESGGHL
jgi:hypothetical protein